MRSALPFVMIFVVSMCCPLRSAASLLFYEILSGRDTKIANPLSALSEEAVEVRIIWPPNWSHLEQIQIPLPSGSKLVVNRVLFEQRDAQSYGWLGKSRLGDVALTVQGDTIVVSVFTDTVSYQILGRGDRGILVTVPPLASSCLSGGSLGARGLIAGCDDGSALTPAVEEVVVDVMALFTPEAQLAAEQDPNLPDISTIIQNAIDISNLAFINSDANVRFRAVHVGAVPSSYMEVGVLSDDLGNAVLNTDMWELRNEYSADLVGIIVSETESENRFGLARTMIRGSVTVDFAPLAYQVSRFDAAALNLTYAHEHGHNMGLQHDPFALKVSPPEDASFCFSYGHVNVDAPMPFRSVLGSDAICMGSPCPRLPYFSNRFVSDPLNGLPFGQSVLGDERENYRTLNLTVPIVSKFRAENDHFLNRLILSGDSGSVDGSNYFASIEADEPLHAPNGRSSVWWEWTAPSSGELVLSTAGSTFDTVLAVYSGPTLASLDLVIKDDQPGDTEELTFAVTGGFSYQIAVDGTSLEEEGDIILSWSLSRAVADLSVTVNDLEDPIAIGSSVEYTVDVANLGPGDATSVTISNPVPANTLFVFGSLVGSPFSICEEAGGLITCDVDLLQAGAQAAAIIELEPLEPGLVTNVAAVNLAENDPVAANNGATEETTVLAGPFADLQLSLTTEPAPVTVGATVEYALSITNTGAFDATDVILEYSLPQGWMLDSTLPAGICSSAGGDVVCSIGDLADGLDFELILRVVAGDAGFYESIVAASASEIDPNELNNSLKIIVEVLNSSDVVFHDSFESGGVGGWSEVSGLPPKLDCPCFTRADLQNVFPTPDGVRCGVPSGLFPGGMGIDQTLPSGYDSFDVIAEDIHLCAVTLNGGGSALPVTDEEAAACGCLIEQHATLLGLTCGPDPVPFDCGNSVLSQP